MRVLIIADTDLDGTGAAAIITKYHELNTTRSLMPPFKVQADEIRTYFPERGDLNKNFEDEDWVRFIVKEHDLIYLCDTGLNSEKGNKNLGEIAAPKTIYFDHHASNLERQRPYIENFKEFHVEEGPRCTAKIAYDTLYARLYKNNPKKASEFRELQKFALFVNDVDLAYWECPRALELADFVTIVGPKEAYIELLTVCTDPDSSTPFIDQMLKVVQDQKERSLHLAKATLVKHKGYKTPFYTCLVDDWASWVSTQIVAKTGMIAMFDVRRKSLSFRVSRRYAGEAWHKTKGKKPNCLDFAEVLGGGGHPQAAGVSSEEASPIFRELSKRLGELLLEVHKNDRRRSSAKR